MKLRRRKVRPSWIIGKHHFLITESNFCSSGPINGRPRDDYNTSIYFEFLGPAHIGGARIGGVIIGGVIHHWWCMGTGGAELVQVPIVPKEGCVGESAKTLAHPKNDSRDDHFQFSNVTQFIFETGVVFRFMRLDLWRSSDGRCASGQHPFITSTKRNHFKSHDSIGPNSEAARNQETPHAGSLGCIHNMGIFTYKGTHQAARRDLLQGTGSRCTINITYSENPPSFVEGSRKLAPRNAHKSGGAFFIAPSLTNPPKVRRPENTFMATLSSFRSQVEDEASLRNDGRAKLHLTKCLFVGCLQPNLSHAGTWNFLHGRTKGLATRPRSPIFDF
ncbi:unnamed protein product [Nesidiocoris tenuis]|uniref:Uncharacterized protein n=1 Tax=Nesidiocoris tenuis TaxID=355587 RepID=A0A6H5HEB6_9HEMI|nr:unnamed protein product [Nesidiocoris tenuis]